MKKSARRRRKAAPARPTGGNAAPAPGVSRRALLSRAGYASLAVMAVGGAGAWAVGHVRAIRADHDLGRLGRGIPAVVQVHDPQCPVCNALQRQTRKALSGFEDSEVIYLVANIRTAEGTAFAARHGAPHVTLLLFDGAGRLRDTLHGPREAEELRPSLARLVRQG